MSDDVLVSTKRRPPEEVMRLERMGSSHQCRLSFMRILLRRLKKEGWVFTRPVFSFDVWGEGRAVYSASGPGATYSLVCFGHILAAEERSDRVIAQRWDSTFTLFNGVPTEADISRLAENIPYQEAGRICQSELVLARANRSVRLFDYVVDSLADGRQPDEQKCLSIGYLMRTTAVYGSGKFGGADREQLLDCEELSAPFQAELLSVYLIRAYSLDLVEHMARLRNPDKAVVLSPFLRRIFGIGNSTGLGMAPFVLNHPVLINNWVMAREEALSRIFALEAASAAVQEVFLNFAKRARLNLDIWFSEHPVQLEKKKSLDKDLRLLVGHIEAGALLLASPWQSLYEWGVENLSLEGQEQLVSLILEPYGDIIDDCAGMMKADEAEAFTIDGAMRLSDIRLFIEEDYGWALAIDWGLEESQARVWYVSAEKLEPRLGQRFEEPVGDYEQPLSPGRDVKLFYDDIVGWSGGDDLAGFLLAFPLHRHIARRIQITLRFPYAEIRDNTVSASMMPIDILRFKLSFFGAIHFDPRSDRWVRINMFKNAPFPSDLSDCDADDWLYPPFERAWYDLLTERD